MCFLASAHTTRTSGEQKVVELIVTAGGSKDIAAANHHVCNIFLVRNVSKCPTIPKYLELLWCSENVACVHAPEAQITIHAAAHGLTNSTCSVLAVP